MDVERQSGQDRPSSPSSLSSESNEGYHRDVSPSSSTREDGTEKSPFLTHDEGNSGIGDRRRYRKGSSWKTTVSAVASLFGVFVFFLVFFVFDRFLPGATRLDGATPTHTIDEQIPPAPRLRDSSEYVLSSSWDYASAKSVREYHWTIRDAIFNPDGIFRPMILINNQFPGPLVECNEGDTIIVHVHNEAANATAIHFHGMFQNGTNSMDGTVGVTQCPIAPNTTFTYQFTVDGQSGTYWYHAHHSAQSSDGVVGPMVVHSRNEKKEADAYASDRVVMIQDHYHNTSAELLMDYLQPDQENDEPVPSSGLINGQNYRNCADFDGWHCENKVSQLESLASFDLTPGQKHRLRFINTGAFAEFQVEIDEHPFHVTEVDGTQVASASFHRLNILPAQRYSVVIDTNVTTADSFWMRARMVTHCFAKENQWLDPEVRAIISYSKTSEHATIAQEPQTKGWGEAHDVDCRDMDTSTLQPVEAIAAPATTASMYLRANFEIGAWRLSRGFFNKSTWHGNVTSPTLYRIMETAQAEDETALPQITGVNEVAFDPEKEFVYQTTGIETVDIVISNFDDGAHPFHLHGHKLFVLKQSPTGYPPENITELEEELTASGVLANPLRRDTITVQGYGWAVIRVVLDNPGMWAFHCHNAWHAESGMMMVIAARVETARDWKVSEEEKGLCGLPGVEKGVRPDDEIWYGNFGD
ncbi:l-ascorbate oxidase [Colletotrichum asianum]|uniref:L-ascorbate oxidase n=1 Tax=Colletotrichum asianum TaxID=702518 RepID=A0A8H3ZIP6_9PEZI|nr:l-ascorbate oxidase [Colletotrichum asianum]